MPSKHRYDTLVLALLVTLSLAMLPACGGGAAPVAEGEGETAVEAAEPEGEETPEATDDHVGDDGGDDDVEAEEPQEVDAESAQDATDGESAEDGQSQEVQDPMGEEGYFSAASVISMDGEQILAAAEEHDYSWYEGDFTQCLISSDAECMLLIGTPGEEQLFDRERIGELAAGGEGDAVQYGILTPAPSTADDVLEGIDVRAAYRVEASPTYVAFSFDDGATGRRWFVTVDMEGVDEGASCFVNVYNQEAVEAGLTSSEDANILNEVWL